MLTAETQALFFTSDKRSLFIGAVEPTLKKSNTASTLLLALEKSFQITDTRSGKTLELKSLLIPAGSSVTVQTHGAVIAQCFLDDLGTDLARLVPHMEQQIHTDNHQTCYGQIADEARLIEKIADLLQVRPSCTEALAQLDQYLTAYPLLGNYSYDRRVEQAISLIKKNYSEILSVEDVAASVGLSVPRFSQLFKQVTGVPVRRFRLWHRIFATAAKMREGCSLTEAAIDSGFADYSQMCRVFKELTGSRPSAIKAKAGSSSRLMAA